MNSLDESQPGHLPNVQILGRACRLAYRPAEEGRKMFQEELGWDASLISVNNTQAYVAQGEDAIVVAFRGSESPASLDGFKDWLLTNANNLLILPEGRLGTDFVAAGVGARFHRGFMQALADVWDPLFQAVQQAVDDRERPLWIAGHSLGGALAQLAAWRFQRQFLTVHELVTFGAPMVGNDVAAAAFEREFPGKIYRFIDRQDPVPLLPTMSLVANAYRHCPREMALGDGSSASMASIFGQLAKGVVENVLNASLADEVWRILQRSIQAHLMPSYLKRLGK